MEAPSLVDFITKHYERPENVPCGAGFYGEEMGMINQICPVIHRRPLKAEILLCCCYCVRMYRLIWMSKVVLLDVYEHLLPRSSITFRNKYSI